MQKSLKPTIALCIIAKDSPDELERAQKAIDSVKEYVDEVCLSPNLLKDWNDDYSAIRNHNFSQATSDWILWLDADDTLEHPEKLRDLVEYAELNRVEGFYFKYKYGFDANGNCIDEHWKGQLLKNNGHFEWKGAIHEDPIQLRPARWVKVEDCVRVHNTDQERTKESFERNLRILLKERERDPKEPRTLFYLGRTYLSTGEFGKCVEVLEQYLELSGWSEERYEARLLIGECLSRSEQIEDALTVYTAAILEKETYPDAYIQKGMCYIKQEKWNDALTNFKIALGMQLPDASTYFNPMNYTRNVWQGIAICYMNLGMFVEALKAVLQALHYDKKNQDLIFLRQTILSLKTKYETAKKYVEIAKYIKTDEGIRRLLASVPPDLTDNAMILSLRNTFMPIKKWPKKSLAVYCGSTVENWTPETQNGKGFGGSETAVVELTKQLAKQGWDVTVFNSCDAPPEGLEFDGVKYQNYWKFNVNDEFDVLWVWRLPELFEYDLKARLKILDLHDVMTPSDLTPERLAKMDKIFVKTQYHRSLYPNVPDDKFVVVGNGIDLSRFEGMERSVKEPYRFAYTSTPNRGLDLVLKMWSKIKEALPEAELHVYYGWDTFYKIEKNNPERMAWMKKIQGLMNQPGVIDHGRVGQKELAEDLLKTSFWLYPTYFPEIHCITACEMQAAGVIPMTSGYAALAETQKVGLKHTGDVYDPKWQSEYTMAVIGVAMSQELGTETLDSIRQKAKEAAQCFSWDKVAEEWNKQLCE